MTQKDSYGIENGVNWFGWMVYRVHVPGFVQVIYKNSIF